MPTYSVRRATGIRGEDYWLASKLMPAWMLFESRVRFKTQNAAELAMRRLFGKDFKHYGIFPNS